MKRLRLAVIGGGHLGRIHARLLSGLDDVELAGVVDPSAEARREVEQLCGAPSYASHHELLGRIDAAVLAAPTRLHHELGLELIRQGVHLLVEKPLASSSHQAERLVQAAEARRVVLQVGHVERFNPAWTAARALVHAPRYVDVVRCSGFTFRSTDIGVVLDLMIHDLDLLLSLTEAEVVAVEALGVSLFGPHEDLAQARLTFADGCVANVAASRASFQPQRKMHIYGAEGYVGIDFAARTARAVRPQPTLLRGRFDPDALDAAEKAYLQEHLFQELLRLEEVAVDDRNALLDELRAFVASVQQSRTPPVTGQQACAALRLGERILEQIRLHRWSAGPGATSGPLAAAGAQVLPGPHFLRAPAATPGGERKAG